MNFSASEVAKWYAYRMSPAGIDDRAYLRVGQSFFNYFKCEKVTGKNTVLLNKLYQLDGQEAQKMIASMIDYSQ